MNAQGLADPFGRLLWAPALPGAVHDIRAAHEHGIVATPKSWRLLRKLRCSTTRITSLVQAALTLHLTSSA